MRVSALINLTTTAAVVMLLQGLVLSALRLMVR
jgi:hypothetical protein